MITTLAHTWYLSGRHLRAAWREPWYIAFSLVQPVVYLLLFGALFQRVAMAPGLMPGWMQLVARFNSVNWAVDGARAALAPGGDWGLVVSQASLLLVLAIVCAWASLRAFDAFRRSR